MLSTTNPTVSFLSQTDLSNIEAEYKSGARLTVKDLATRYGVKVSTMRTALSVAFHGRITFKRGRTGGISLTV